MDKFTKTTLGLAIVLCVYVGTCMPAFAAEEFIKVGHEVTSKGAEAAYLTVTNGTITCASSTGKGKVANKSLLELELTFESCKAVLGKEKPIEAKISACHLSFSAENSVTFGEGCKAKAAECEIELTPGENKGRKEVGYVNLKEKEEGKEALEMEMFAAVEKLAYKVGTGCKTFGVEGGAEGVLSYTQIAQGVNVLIQRKFKIEGGAGGVALVKMEVATGTEHAITFPPKANGKFIKCSVAKSEAFSPQNEEANRMEVGPIEYSTCKTNIIGSSESPVEVHVTCASFVGLFAIPASVAQPWPGGLSFETLGCTFKAKVSLCEIIFRTPTGGAGVHFKNSGNNPKTIKVVMSEAGSSPEFVIPYEANSGCTGVSPGPALAKYKGASEIVSSVGGVAKNIEIK